MDYTKLNWQALRKEAKNRGINIYAKGRNDLEEELKELDAGLKVTPEEPTKLEVTGLKEPEGCDCEKEDCEKGCHPKTTAEVLAEADQIIEEFGKPDETFAKRVFELEHICDSLAKQILDGGYRRKIYDVKENARDLLSENSMCVILELLRDEMKDGNNKAKVQAYLNNLYDKPEPGALEERPTDDEADTETKEVAS